MRDEYDFSNAQPNPYPDKLPQAYLEEIAPIDQKIKDCEDIISALSEDMVDFEDMFDKLDRYKKSKRNEIREYLDGIALNASIVFSKYEEKLRIARKYFPDDSEVIKEIVDQLHRTGPRERLVKQLVVKARLLSGYDKDGFVEDDDFDFEDDFDDESYYGDDDDLEESSSRHTKKKERSEQKSDDYDDETFADDMFFYGVLMPKIIKKGPYKDRYKE